ncbi:MAG: hypothetical protein K6G83_09685 [Lachnospiraceae bacterium]|nr:hypothetical protein [Lachnospiraceae bacterium]
MEKYRQNLRLFLAWRKLLWKNRMVDSIDFRAERVEKEGVFKDQRLNGTGEIIALRRYHRYWISKSRREKNLCAGEFDRLILDLKERNCKAIKYFEKMIAPFLRKGFTICVVPSSYSSVRNNGIRYLGRKLTENGRKDCTGFLIRQFDIKKLTEGGNRSKRIHYASIRVAEDVSIDGEDVLLLDDITTSGNSLRACRDILIANGARSVEMLALGRTDECGINLLEGSYIAGFGMPIRGL